MEPTLIPLASHDVAWCVNRLPKKVREATKAGRCVLAGGFIRSCIAREPIADVDLFVTSKEAGQKLANWLGFDDYEGGEKAVKPFETANAFTVRAPWIGIPVQVIHRWVFSEPAAIVQSFDFTIACAAIWFDPAKQEWHSLADPAFYQDLAAKRLVYRSPVRNEDAGGSLLRVLKFYQKGYRIPLASLGACLARLVEAVDMDKYELDPGGSSHENWLASILTGLLVEVDPSIDVPIADDLTPNETREALKS